MKIVDYTAEPLLVPALEATDRPGVYAELAERLHQGGCIGEVRAFMQEIRAPDGVFHLGAQHGVVFAWARGRFVRKTGFALGKSGRGVSFAQTPEALVHLVFLIAAPTAKGCVDLLTTLPKLLSNEEVRGKLLAAQTPQEMYAAFALQPQMPVSTQLGLFQQSQP